MNDTIKQCVECKSDYILEKVFGYYYNGMSDKCQECLEWQSNAIYYDLYSR